MSINAFFDRFTQKYAAGELNETEDLDQLFNEHLTETMAGLLIEDHEKKMTATEMAAHIKKLFKMCDDKETEEKFLERLGKKADVENCKEKDIKDCAKKFCDMDAEKCDDVIHELEGMVGYKQEGDDDKDDEDDKDSKKKLDEKIASGSIIRTSSRSP